MKEESKIRRRRRRSGRRSDASGQKPREPREGRKAVTRAVTEGATQSRSNLRGAFKPVLGALRSLLLAVLGIFFDLVALVLNLAIGVIHLLSGPGRRALGATGRIVRAASRLLTPPRALAIVVAGAAVLLALSQFADYRSVSIGTDAYSDVQTVAPAPEVDRRQTGDPHSYAFVPIAAAALLLLGGAMRGRWRLCRLIALCGVAAIAVALIVDRPAGLDPGVVAQEFEGVRASLLGGYYAELFAGALLAVSAMMLGRELRLAGVTKPAPSRRTRKRRAPLLGRRRRGTMQGARA